MRTGPLGRQVFVRSRTGFPLRGEVLSAGGRIAWGVTISHATAVEGMAVRFSAWALRPDPPAPARRILFRGAAGPVHAAQGGSRRMDVMRALSISADAADPVVHCGFRGEFVTGEAGLEVVIEGDGFSAVIGRVEFPPPGVVAGQDGWLFLAGDTNDSVAQHADSYHPTAAWARQWRDYFAAVRAIPAEKAIFLVAPAKEAVMPERHPLPRSPQTPVTHLLSAHSDRMLFPREELRADRDSTYDRTDTHWTDYGGRIACEIMLARLGETVPPVPATYAMVEKPGDLGDKLVPAERDRRLEAAWPGARLVFDNLVLHHGNIRIWSNPEAPLKKTVVIFGGSSSEQMIPYLGAIYARIVSVYGAGSWDVAIIAHERPDIVILQTNERFLVTPPAPHFDCRETVRRKIAGAHLTGRGDRAELLRQFVASGEDWYFDRYAVLADSHAPARPQMALDPGAILGRAAEIALPSRGDADPDPSRPANGT